MSRHILDEQATQADRYVALFRDRDAPAKERLQRAQTEAQYAEEQLRACMQSLEVAERQLATTQADDNTMRTAEFNKLLEHPDIESVAVGLDHIQVTTGPILIPFEGSTYALGAFAIRVQIYPEQTDVTIRNLTRIIGDGVDHPHIFQGVPCWGNVGPTLRLLLQEKRYPAVIALCIQFLKSYTDDAGAPYLMIGNWPLDGEPGTPDELVTLDDQPISDSNDYDIDVPYDDDDCPF